MIVARQKKKENPAEYLLYMWQVEDLIRACRFDAELLARVASGRFDVDEGTRREIVGWYDNLRQMMRNERIEERGHLQINRNTLNELNEWHLSFLQKEMPYEIAYGKILPLLADLRLKGSAADVDMCDLEVCFNALYMTMIMRMQGRALSPETEKAVAQIGEFVKMLVAKIKRKEKEDEQVNG